MEIIRIAGYTELEKLSIAKKYLWRSKRAANGLTPENLVFTDKRYLGVIRHYTKEAGVSNLEREIAFDLPESRGRGDTRKIVTRTSRSGPRASTSSRAR